MRNKIMSSLAYIICLALGLLTFIFSVFPYLELFGYVEATSYLPENYYYEAFKGYTVMSFWSDNAWEVLAAIFQIILVILSALMIVYGIVGIFKTVFDIEKLPDELLDMRCKKVASVAIYSYLVIIIIELVLLSIVCNANTFSAEVYEQIVTVECRLGDGIFIALFFALAGSAFIFIKNRKDSQTIEDVSYVCTKCGKRAHKDIKYCPVCGAAIAIDRGCFCTKCGKKVKKGMNFCPDCGGEVSVRMESISNETAE